MPCAAIQGSKCRGSKNPTQKKGAANELAAPSDSYSIVWPG